MLDARGRAALGVLALGMGLGAAACRTKSKRGKPDRACIEAMTKLDHAIGLQDFDRARDARPAAYRLCTDKAELAALDLRLSDAEANATLREAALAEQQVRTHEVAKAFLDFVATERAHPEQASNAPRCDAAFTGGDAGVPAFGTAPEELCTAKRQLGRYVVELRYLKADPQAFRFTIHVDGGLDCAALDAKAVATWKVPLPGKPSVDRASCALGGALAGLTGVVSSGAASSIHVYSPSYLAHEPGAREALAPPVIP
jgi:hypothetical protein